MTQIGVGCAALLDTKALGGDEPKLEPPSQEMGHAIGRGDMVDVGQGDTAVWISHPKSNNGSGNEDIMMCAEGCGDIKMPPSSISVVALIGERSFENINIPLDGQSDNVQIGQDIKFVSAEFAGKLLRQIAGLTTIAMQRAEEARDLVSRHQQHTVTTEPLFAQLKGVCMWQDALLSHRTMELLALRREMVQYRDGQYKPQTEPSRVYGVAGRANIREQRECQLKSSGAMYCGRGEKQFRRDEDNKIDSTTECLSSSRSDEKMSDIDGEVENAFAAIEAEKVGVKVDQHPKRKRMRSYKSVSERPGDVIYGSWKMTKSE